MDPCYFATKIFFVCRDSKVKVDLKLLHLEIGFLKIIFLSQQHWHWKLYLVNFNILHDLSLETVILVAHIEL